MKRLIKKSKEVDINYVETMNSMQQLNELDEADVRHDRCPSCKYNGLARENGFKKCPRCGSLYKVLNGDGFIIN